MNKPEELGFLAIFGQLDDPRIERNQWHPMPEILLLTLGATRVGCADDRKHINREKMYLMRFVPQHILRELVDQNTSGPEVNNRIDEAFHEQNHFHQCKQLFDSFSGKRLFEFGSSAELRGRLWGV